MKAYALQFSEERLSDGADQNEDGETKDYCCQGGAYALKAMIEAYWAARGQHVMVSLHNVGFHPAIRAARFDVRSDMLNGKPRTVAGEGRSFVKAAAGFVEHLPGDDCASE